MTINSEQIQALRAAAENLATAEERYDRAEITIREYISVNDHYHNFVKDPANILSLLAERDADKALIAEQDARLIEYARIATENAARTLTVTLPDEKFCPAEYAGSLLWSETEIWNNAISACKSALEKSCAAAGITLVVGE